MSKQLNAEAIDPDMKSIFLHRLANNMDRSFALSETLLHDYSIKKLDKFKKLKIII